jgi:hypothetical protein
MYNKMEKHSFGCYLAVLCFMTFFYDLNAQILIEGYVLDSNDDPIPYTSVYANDYQKGTHTKPKGFFSLEVPQIPIIVQFSNVGYESLEKEIIDQNEVQVRLSEKTMLLDEVHIYSDEVKSRYIGSPRNKKGIMCYVASRPFYQLGLRVDNQNQQLYKESILVSISIKVVPSWMGSVKLDGTNQIRLRVYDIAQNEIGESILHENVFFAPKKGGWYTKNLKAPLLLPENGFLIAVEWLKELEFVETKSRKHTFLPTYGLEIWGHNLEEAADELSYYSTWEYEPSENKWKREATLEFSIPTFRLEIKEYK